MRINININDKLMAEALSLSRFNTKIEVIEEGLKLLVQRKKQENIKNLKGKLQWHGDLKKMRSDHK